MLSPTEASQLVLGWDWQGWTPPQTPPTVWRRDRWNSKKADLLEAMPKHFGNTDITPAGLQAMLETVQADKLRTKKFYESVIDRFWIELGNCIGLKATSDLGHLRPVATIKDLQEALKDVTPATLKHMMVHFVFNFSRDHLYPGTLMITHQWACAQAALRVLNVSFVPQDTTGQHKKTCLEKLYGEVYNDKKHRLCRQIMEKGFSVGVEHRNIVKPKNWKRNKFTFFLHRAAYAGYPSETKELDLRQCNQLVAWQHQVQQRLLLLRQKSCAVAMRPLPIHKPTTANAWDDLDDWAKDHIDDGTVATPAPAMLTTKMDMDNDSTTNTSATETEDDDTQAPMSPPNVAQKPQTQETPEMIRECPGPQGQRNDASLNLGPSVVPRQLATMQDDTAKQTANQNVRNKCKAQKGKVAKASKLSKNSIRLKTNQRTPKATAKPSHAGPKTPERKGNACAIHGLDWIDLQEVNHAKKYLGQQCYLNGKQCRECKQAFTTVVERRLAVYHCPEDFRAFDLETHNAPQACHCIVCSKCFVVHSEQVGRGRRRRP